MGSCMRVCTWVRPASSAWQTEVQRCPHPAFSFSSHSGHTLHFTIHGLVGTKYGIALPIAMLVIVIDLAQKCELHACVPDREHPIAVQTFICMRVDLVPFSLILGAVGSCGNVGGRQKLRSH